MALPLSTLGAGLLAEIRLSGFSSREGIWRFLGEGTLGFIKDTFTTRLAKGFILLRACMIYRSGMIPYTLLVM